MSFPKVSIESKIKDVLTSKVSFPLSSTLYSLIPTIATAFTLLLYEIIKSEEPYLRIVSISPWFLKIILSVPSKNKFPEESVELIAAAICDRGLYPVRPKGRGPEKPVEKSWIYIF